MIPKVFIDTNVWFSAFWGSENCQKIIRASINGKISAVISSQVLKELINNLHKKIPKALPALNTLLTNIPLTVIKDAESCPKKLENYIEKKDRLIFASACVFKADYFVTGNLKDFSVANIHKLTDIKIVNPSELVKLIGL